MRRSFTACILSLPLVLACASSTPGPGPAIGQDGKLVSPSTGVEVSVAIASARLGEEGCTHDESTDVAAKSCAAPVPGAPRGTGLCGGPCVFSNVQLSLTTTGSSAAAHVSIVRAAIVDVATGSEIQAISAYTPLAWDGTTYKAWDENVAPASEVKASYTVSPPTWSQIDAGGNYSRQYQFRIVVGLDGATITLDSTAMSRDPPVAT
jgi:hypothetical protein